MMKLMKMGNMMKTVMQCRKIMKMASKDHLSDDDDDDNDHLPTIHSIRIPFLPPLSHL